MANQDYGKLIQFAIDREDLTRLISVLNWIWRHTWRRAHLPHTDHAYYRNEALIYAVEKRRLPIANWLLANGAYVNTTLSLPIRLALDNGDYPMVVLLVSAGSKLSMALIDKSIEENYLQIFKFLVPLYSRDEKDEILSQTVIHRRGEMRNYVISLLQDLGEHIPESSR